MKLIARCVQIFRNIVIYTRHVIMVINIYTDRFRFP